MASPRVITSLLTPSKEELAAIRASTFWPRQEIYEKWFKEKGWDTSLESLELGEADSRKKTIQVLNALGITTIPQLLDESPYSMGFSTPYNNNHVLVPGDARPTYLKHVAPYINKALAARGLSIVAPDKAVPTFSDELKQTIASGLQELRKKGYAKEEEKKAVEQFLSETSFNGRPLSELRIESFGFETNTINGLKWIPVAELLTMRQEELVCLNMISCGAQRISLIPEKLGAFGLSLKPNNQPATLEYHLENQWGLTQKEIAFVKENILPHVPNEQFRDGVKNMLEQFNPKR